MNHWFFSWQNYPPEAWRYIFNVMWYHSCCNYCCLFPPLMDDVTDTCNDDHDDNNIWSLIGSTHSGQFKVRHYDNLKFYSNIWTIICTSCVSRADIAFGKATVANNDDKQQQELLDRVSKIMYFIYFYFTTLSLWFHPDFWTFYPWFPPNFWKTCFSWLQMLGVEENDFLTLSIGFS